MNCTLDIVTDITHDEITTESAYTTAPIIAIKPIYHQPNEEELHTSFEKAISERQVALHNRLSRISNPILNVPCSKSNTDSLLSNVAQNTTTVTSSGSRFAISSHIITWQRATILSCLALIFILLYFDFTSLLTFHIH